MTMYSSSGRAHTCGSYQSGHAYGTSSGYGATIRKPATFMRIKCFKDPPPALEGIIDARKFLEYNCPEALAELETERASLAAHRSGPDSED